MYPLSVDKHWGFWNLCNRQISGSWTKSSRKVCLTSTVTDTPVKFNQPQSEFGGWLLLILNVAHIQLASYKGDPPVVKWVMGCVQICSFSPSLILLNPVVIDFWIDVPFQFLNLYCICFKSQLSFVYITAEVYVNYCVIQSTQNTIKY